MTLSKTILYYCVEFRILFILYYYAECRYAECRSAINSFIGLVPVSGSASRPGPSETRCQVGGLRPPWLVLTKTLTGITKGGSITVPFTSCLTGLD
jgi:hypothetical protein